MPPTPCHLCGNKWIVLGGGLCAVCRTLDRLSAITRGPEIPREAEQVVLQKLRACIGDLQDVGELYRGVAPNPVQALLRPKEEEGPPSGDVGAGSGAKGHVVGAAAKVLPAPPPPPVPGAGDIEEPAAEERAGKPPDRKEVASSSKTSRKAKKERSKSRHRREPKQSRRSRSGRSRPRRSPRLTSPVRPSGVKSERSESEEPSERRERKTRPWQPRSPPGSPPRGRERGAAPSHRPEGRRWEGPIRAPPREPPPGQGVHFGKNKGRKQREKREAYRRRQQRYWGQRR